MVGACFVCSLSRRAVLTELKLTSGGEVLEITQSSLTDLTEFCMRVILDLLDAFQLGGRKMPVKVTQTAAQWAAHELEEVLMAEDAEPPSELRKVTIRLPEETVALLDYLGGKLRHSRSAIAENLLIRAVEEAICEVGLPGEEDGFQLSLNAEEFQRMQAEKVAA